MRTDRRPQGVRRALWAAGVWILSALVAATLTEADMQQIERTADRTTLTNGHLDVQWSGGRWTVRWPDQPEAVVRQAATQIVLDGERHTLAPPDWECAIRAVNVQDGLGKARALRAVYERQGVRVSVVARLIPNQPSVTFTAGVRNAGVDALTVGGMSALVADRATLGATGDADPVVYVDSGGQGGTQMSALGQGQTTAGICALHTPGSGASLVCAFVSFEHDNQVQVAPAGDGLKLEARTTTAVRLEPGEEHVWDAVLLDCRPSPYEALEEYATAVKALVRPPVPATMPMGWLSWYAYRLTMTEDIVLQNAQVVARRFRKYGVTMIHPDHGWQYQDICGNWVPNERFPHGMRWLSDRLGEMGMTLGLWVAPSTVSEFAPLYAERPEALMRDASGQPLVIGERWSWPPHGRTFNLDPLTPEGEQSLREIGTLLRFYGVVYVKMYFIGTWGGAVRLRRGMRILREALGPDITIRPCSTALNTQLGVCNEIGIARDIGNAAGNWEDMRVETLELASKWFMHGKFWLNNPDVLIVGDAGETLGEAQGRVTLLALTGGVVFLGDKLPELEQQPERLRLVHLCLPSSGQPARPIDLFRVGEAGRDYPRIWHLHAQREWGEWEVVGVFNWSDEPLEETISREDLGLGRGEYVVFDFWAGKPLGRMGGELTVAVEPGSVRCLRVIRRPDRPTVLGTDMHVTQGLVDLDRVCWDEEKLMLSGEAVRAPGEEGAVYVYVPEGFRVVRDGSQAEAVAADCVRVPVEFSRARERWAVRFRRR